MRVSDVASEYPRITVHWELEPTIFSRAQARSNESIRRSQTAATVGTATTDRSF